MFLLAICLFLSWNWFVWVWLFFFAICNKLFTRYMDRRTDRRTDIQFIQFKWIQPTRNVMVNEYVTWKIFTNCMEWNYFFVVISSNYIYLQHYLLTYPLVMTPSNLFISTSMDLSKIALKIHWAKKNNSIEWRYIWEKFRREYVM